MFTAIFDLYQMQHDFVACYCSCSNVHVRDVGSVYLKIIILSVRFINFVIFMNHFLPFMHWFWLIMLWS